MATATLIEIGPGHAAIIVTVDNKAEVKRYESAYGTQDEPEAMPEPEPTGLDCLPSKVAFTHWNCETGTTAAALFELLQTRDVTAIHLWNTTSWVRYSLVDGAEVPGSSNFTIVEDDQLYISN